MIFIDLNVVEELNENNMVESSKYNILHTPNESSGTYDLYK